MDVLLAQSIMVLFLAGMAVVGVVVVATAGFYW
jgi:hypothetical protein